MQTTPDERCAMLCLSLLDLQALLDIRLEELVRAESDPVAPTGPPWQRAVIESITDDVLIARVRPVHASLRPGGTWSGPSQFELVDMVGFLLVVANLPLGSDALTIACNINFLQPPPSDDLRGEARMLRMSGRSAVVDVDLRSVHGDDILARATISYTCRPGPDTAMGVAARNSRQNMNEKDGVACT